MQQLYSCDFDSFLDAIGEGNLQEVKSHFKPEYVNMKDENGIRPLHWACEWDSSGQVVQYLIERGCDIDQEANWGQTPLHIAAWMGHIDVVRLLLGENSRLDARDEGGRTPLDLAIEEGRDTCVEILMDAIRNTETLIVLPYVTERKRRKDPIFNLIKKNSLSKIVDQETGKTLLDVAFETNDRRVINFVKKKPLDDEEFKDFLAMKLRRVNPLSIMLLSECLLYRCIYQRNDHIFLALLSPEILNHKPRFMRGTVLERMASLGIAVFVKYILNFLAHVDDSWARAKMIAKRKRCSEVLTVISKREELMVLRHKSGSTRLHTAVIDNEPSMVEYILENNIVDPNQVSPKAGSALALAYMLGSVECIHVMHCYKSVVPSEKDYEIMVENAFTPELNEYLRRYKPKTSKY